MLVEIILEPKRSTQWPKVKIAINDETIFDGFCEPNNKKYFKISKQISSPYDRNSLKITHYDKDGRQTILDENGDTVSDRAVILKSISIDKNKVPEVILYDKYFEIKYTPQQIAENNGMPNRMKNNLYFGFNGTYTYVFGADPMKHYYENLLEKERLVNISNKKTLTRPNGEIVEAFEFTGKLVESGQKESITIEELYKKVHNEV